MKVTFQVLASCPLVTTGSNAVIKYTLLGVSPPGPHPFSVNSTTGSISAMEFGLDREDVAEYRLSIQVRTSFRKFNLVPNSVISAGLRWLDSKLN